MIKKQKGTVDIYNDAKIWKYIDFIIDEVMTRYNYKYIRTPIFEDTSLFVRGVGDSTDIVSKEMYNFKDKGNRDISLRPEGTAGVVRSYIENKVYADSINPTKYYYNGTMYRYERPQNGRLREFTQFGCEVLNTNDPLMDAEVISLSYNILKSLNIDCKIIINSLGNKESREKYREKLIRHFKKDINSLCDDCKKRYETNPLRILDCKKDNDKDIFKNIPTMIDNLDNDSKKRFETVLEYLDILKIPYEIDNNLVRGLDYYNDTVFEIVTNDDIGSLGGGGRYSTLVKELDGPDVDGIGFAVGLDRVVKTIKDNNIKVPKHDFVDIFIMYVNEEEKKYALYLTNELRATGFIVDTEYNNGSLKAQFKKGDRLNSRFNIILNSEDLNNGEIKIKNNKTKEEDVIAIEMLIYYLQEKLFAMNHEDCSCGSECSCHDNHEDCSCGSKCSCHDNHEDYGCNH